MSVVTDEDMDRLFAGSEESGEETDSPEVEASESAEAPAEVEAAPEAEEFEAQEEQESGHAVPYSRFSKVIAARNAAQAELEQHQSQISSLQQELAEAKRFRSFLESQQQPAQPAVQQAEEPYLDPSVAGKFHELTQRFEALEHDRAVERETQVVISEVNAAKAAHPNVPEEAFYEALTRNPRADLNAFGSQYAQRLSEIEEAAIARYLKDNVADNSPDVPPEVGSQRTKSGQSTARPADNLTWQESLDRLFT